MRRLHYPAFEQLNRMGKLLLIFDGFDEMAARVHKQEMINNFWELAKVVVPGAKVILTCRTEHFPEAQQGRALLNAELRASTANLTGETPQFEVLELEKFNDEQIRQVLLHQAEAETVEQVMGNAQLLDLARRPVMTDLIVEALPDIKAGKPVDMSRVYLYAVRRKMERDIKAERTFTSLADKLYFLCELSWEMLSTDQMSINYKLFPDRIRRLFGSMVQEQNDLDHWHYDMMGQTMLIRNGNGDYTPAHRSLLEFFVAYKFAAELGALADDFTELAQAQSCVDGNFAAVDYTWSGYFERQLDNSGNCIAIAPLKGFIREPLEKLRETFGRSSLTKAVMDLMLGMVGDNEALVKVIEITRGRSEEEVGYVGGNAVTLSVKVDKGALEGRDFSGAIIKGADFSNANLQYVNFKATNLIDSTFTQLFSRVHSVAFSPDGKFLAASDATGQIYIWKIPEGKQVFAFQSHNLWIWSVAFSPDSKILATAAGTKNIKLWDFKTCQLLQTLTGHTSCIRTLSFSPDGKILACAGEDEDVLLWNINTGEYLGIKIEHTNRINSVVFSPDGQIIATANNNNHNICLWNPKTGECLNVLEGHTHWVRSLAWKSDSTNIVSVSDDKTIRIWDIKTGNCIKIFRGHEKTIRSVT